jgi:hypothetical protein
MAYTSYYYYYKIMQVIYFTLSETQMRKQTEKIRYKEASIYIVMEEWEEICWKSHRR